MEHCKCRNPQCGLEMCYQPKIIEMLKYISVLFKRENISFWLDKGTLIGALRNSRMISWDNDVDLGVWFSDNKRIMDLAPKILEEDGYSLEVSTATQLIFKYSPVCIWSICLNGWKVKDKEAYIPQYPQYHCPKENVQILDKIMFEGEEYPCPQHPEICLTNFYGDWKTPRVLSLCKGMVKYFHRSSGYKDVIEEMKRYNYYD